ncbi:MAG: phosphoenolpyruvate--protein phosphotransferase [Phycisphaerae bacterium]
MLREHTFIFPLSNGLHARPASALADRGAGFDADISLIQERTGDEADAKSVLSIIAIDVRQGDACRFRITGADAEAALASLRDFTTHALPACDEPTPPPVGAVEVVLPRMLRNAGVRWHTGTTASEGIGLGRIVPAYGLSWQSEPDLEPISSREEESKKMNRAFAAVQADLAASLADRRLGAQAGILRAHLSIARDATLEGMVRDSVSAGQSAGQAIMKAGTFFAEKLRGSQSAIIRERAIDVEDICHHLLENIDCDRYKAAGLTLNEPSVVVALTLSPRQLLALDKTLLKGLVLEHTGTTAHALILARSFDIPTLTGVANVRAHLAAGQDALVDANLGIVITGINDAVRHYYHLELRKRDRMRERQAAHIREPAATRDGIRLEVAANITTVEELVPAFEQGAEGIGLFRTEMLFMNRSAPPTESEQCTVYTRAAQAAGGRPVIIRTIDVGGDKPLPYLNLPKETNPFLGYRGLRLYLEYRNIIHTQLRAIIRSSAFGTIRVMAPMVSFVDEARGFRDRVSQIQAELKEAGVGFDPSMQIGVMVEVPSLAFMLDQLCAEVDFLSIGTNDLLQYFLAVDRDNPRVGELYQARHPSFLRFLAKITEDARRHGCRVGLCGEMARDRENLPLLVGLGLDEISVAVPDALRLKAELARLDAAECRELLDAALGCRDGEEVDAVLEAFRGSGTASHLLDTELIIIDSDSASREEVIKEIVDAFHIARRTNHPSAVEEAIWAREEIHSTAVGHGFAIPHCQSDAMLANSIGIARLIHPLAWDSTDSEPVRCVILLGIRESDPGGTHMQILSTLARKLMHETFRGRILGATDREAILTVLSEELE